MAERVLMTGNHPLILAVDQSTSATKAFLFDKQGRMVAHKGIPHAQAYPHPGWVEQEAMEIWRNTLLAIDGVLRQADIPDSGIADRICALSISNQRETVLVWDCETGLPIHPAVTWQCGRAVGICRSIEEAGHADVIREKTGLMLSPYFSAAKARWILGHAPGARELADQGRLRMGTMDSWLVWKLTDGRVHATDCSNASRTQLYSLADRQWDPELLEIFGIPAGMLPTIRFSDEIFGTVARTGDPLQDRLAGLPIAGVLGDSHAALFGQNCFSAGMAKATYGTGSSIMMNVGPDPIRSHTGLVTSVAWGRQGSIEYVLEGNINCTGATLQWLAEDLELISSPRESAGYATSVDDNGGVYLVPAFTGLGAPYWDSEARASFTGMSRATKKAHLVRAAEESIAYQIRDIVDLMVQDLMAQGHQAPANGHAIAELRVDGGPTRDTFLMQFQADMLGIPVACAGIGELSAFGACLMGGLAVGLWSGLDEVAALRTAGPLYLPAMEPSRRDALYRGWRQAVRRTLSAGFAE